MKNTENLNLYDSIKSGLYPGVWKIETVQELKKDGKLIHGEKLENSQEFYVENPVFAIKQEGIVQRTPLPDSQGTYTDIIPHIVLNGYVDADGGKLLLLLLKEDEFTKQGDISVKEYMNSKPGVRRATIEAMAEETQGRIYPYISIPVAIFQKLAPLSGEMNYLSHYRQVYIGDKPEMNLNAEGIFTVILSNRIPQYEPGRGEKYEVHLVSVAGLLQAEMSKEECVELLSLDSWKFTVTGKKPNSFRKICEKIQQEKNTPWMLRLSVPEAATQNQEVVMRLNKGYVPLLYNTRTKEKGICWSRGACTPIRTALLQRESVCETADSAICYDEEYGIFDVTYAAAFESGRFAAFNDESYLEALLLLRKEAQKRLDIRYEQERWKLAGDIDTRLTEIFERSDMEKIGSAFMEKPTDNYVGNMEVPENEEELELYIERTAEALQQELQQELQPVAEWLGRLWLLYPVPKEDILLHEAILPEESVRFFYLDENWQQALYEGAVSIGLYSKRQSLFNRVFRKILWCSAKEAMRTYRAKLYGENPPEEKKEPYTGFVIRAQLTNLWKTVSVQAKGENGEDLAILRMGHLNSDTLIAIFDGIARTVIMNEPEEALTMRLNLEEYPYLRNESGVLKLEQDGLIAQLMKEKPEKHFGSAAFAKRFLTTGERTVFERGSV